MYRVNTSFVVDGRVHDPWLGIMGQYVDFVRKNGYPNAVLSRVLSIEAADHFTYSLLVEIETVGEYKTLTEEIFSEYTTIAEPLFGSQVLWFNSLMKTVL